MFYTYLEIKTIYRIKKNAKKGKTAKQRDKNNSFEHTEHVTFRKEKRANEAK